MLFALHCLDKPDSVHIRQATRPTHLAYMAEFDTPVGGPLINADGDMCGSLIILEADSLKTAKEFAAGDPYQHAGLFQSVQIHEMKKAVWPGE